MTINEKLKLISEVGEEITTKDELKHLLQTTKNPICYDGFEPSGQIHLPQGLMRAVNINKMTKAGFKFKMLVADWHAYLNHKMGGDLQKIQTVGNYFIEVWKASGMDLSKVEFIWASDLVKTPGYWETVLKLATKNNLPRVLRTVQIMGRSESDTLTASQIIYPLMQAADIFMLKANATQLGMDQRKVNMLARESADYLGFTKPVVISHHMLLGLTPPSDGEKGESAVDRTIRLKMSKSNPDSAIFMTDSKNDVERKINKAYAPEKQIIDNPILEYCKYIVFAIEDTMQIKRPAKYGGNITYKSYAQLQSDYKDGNLYPLDLKIALSEYINKYLQPVRDHFNTNKKAKELAKKVQSYKVTR